MLQTFQAELWLSDSALCVSASPSATEVLHSVRLVHYFTHFYCFPKTTTWWQAGETTNPSSFCPQTDCLGIKITTAETVQRAGVAKLSTWVCLLKHFTVNFPLSLHSFHQDPLLPLAEVNVERAVSSKQCDSGVNARLNWTGFRGLCLCVSACVTGITSPHRKYLTCLAWTAMSNWRRKVKTALFNLHYSHNLTSTTVIQTLFFFPFFFFLSLAFNFLLSHSASDITAHTRALYQKQFLFFVF